MSLAMYASPYDPNESKETKESKNIHAKTQKNISEKVNTALQSIDEDSLADFEEVSIEEIKQNNQAKTNYHKNLIPYVKDYEVNLISETKEIPKDILLEKLNYIIGLLENQQDEKTNNVIEDLLIYSLLGCFIIFIIDKFVSVGRYVRD